MEKFNHDSDDECFPILNDHLPTTDAGDVDFEIYEEAGYGFILLCCNILKFWNYID